MAHRAASPRVFLALLASALFLGGSLLSATSAPLAFSPHNAPLLAGSGDPPPPTG